MGDAACASTQDVINLTLRPSTLRRPSLSPYTTPFLTLEDMCSWSPSKPVGPARWALLSDIHTNVNDTHFSIFRIVVGSYYLPVLDNISSRPHLMKEFNRTVTLSLFFLEISYRLRTVHVSIKYLGLVLNATIKAILRVMGI